MVVVPQSAIPFLLSRAKVSLLVALVADFRESKGQEQANVPGKHVDPERVGDTWPSWEVVKANLDGLVEPPEEALTAEAPDRDRARDGPAAKKERWWWLWWWWWGQPGPIEALTQRERERGGEAR